MPDIYDYEPVFGSWKVGKRLGSGGFGEVYEVFEDNTFSLSTLYANCIGFRQGFGLNGGGAKRGEHRRSHC